jgi:hypothetical protein
MISGERPTRIGRGPFNHDEYISIDSYPRGDNDKARGSFHERDPYTRLISYSRLEDLQADNQLFGPLTDDNLLPGPEPLPGSPRRPWVYMGPGLFQDDSGEDSGHIHIRLSPTDNNVPGFPDYDGPTDPRQVALAIWTSNQATLRVSRCASVYLEGLTVRYGTGR